MADHDPFNAILGKGCRFEGKLTFHGKVRIDGAFAGQIVSSDTLVIGAGADVTAEIDVGSLVLQGKLTGNVRATEAIELKQPAEMRGNLEAPALQIDRGVAFEGMSKMTRPGAQPARPAVAPTPVASPYARAPYAPTPVSAPVPGPVPAPATDAERPDEGAPSAAAPLAPDDRT